MTNSDYNMLMHIVYLFGNRLSSGQSYHDGLSNIFSNCSSDWRDISSIIDDGDFNTFINGTTINNLPEAKYLYQYTKFLDSNFISDDNSLSSKSFTYGKLRDFFIDNSEKAMDLGSMCHENKFEYSKINHKHEGIYSRVDVEMKTDSDLVDKIASISVIEDTSEETKEIKTYDVKIPHVEYNLQPEPYIGTLRFQMIPMIETGKLITDSTTGLSNIDIWDNDFDGWVYPNGSRYILENHEDLQRFETLGHIDMLNIIEHEGTNVTAIILPCLSNYFKLNPGTERLQSSKKVNFHNAIPSHSHRVNSLAVSGRIKPSEGQSIGDNTSGCNTNGTKMHNGNGSLLPRPQVIPITINCNDIEFTNLKMTNSDTGLDVESEPCHYLLPVMMYIGGRRKSFYRD